MRVLELAPYLWCPEIPEGSRNTSGLAYMVRGVVDEVGMRDDVAVSTQSYFVNGVTHVGNFDVAKRTKGDLIRSMSVGYASAGLRYAKLDGGDLGRRLKLMAYFAGGAHAERVIRELKPDVVHIHTMSGYTLPFIMACQRAGARCVVTLHGLVSLDRTVTQVSDAEARLERLLLEESDRGGLPVTMIASGMKARMSECCRSGFPNVRIISNFCGRTFESEAVRHRVVGTIAPRGLRRVLCVGSLGKRKNQRLAIEAVGRIRGQEVELRIVGDGPERASLEEFALRAGSNVCFLGQVNHDQLVEEYVRADLLVMPSLSEGFGLPVLEAYWYGVPAVAFADQDAFADLYDPACMVGVSKRDAEAFAAGMEEALGRTWEREAIFAKAEEFSSGRVGAQYTATLISGGAVPSKRFVKACFAPIGEGA